MTMEEPVRKGLCLGCLLAVVLLAGGVFLFTLMCGLLMKGCVESSQEIADAVSGAEAGEDEPEEPEKFEKVWVRGSTNRQAPKVLRIRLSGVIRSQESPAGFLEDPDEDTAPSALRRIRSACADKALAGLLLEIDSPGGGVTASDELYAAVRAFRHSGSNRFVVVHMGDMCCSGGYYVAAAADRIWARPTSLTGSIGVIMDGVNAAGLAQKLGISSVTIASGANKDLLNPLKEVNPEHVAILQKSVTELYDRFVALVAEGRHLAPATVRKLADGRVFSAREAKSAGLVDGIGYEPDVEQALKALAGGRTVRIIRYREPPSLRHWLDTTLFFSSAGTWTHALRAAVDEAVRPRAEYRLR